MRSDRPEPYRSSHRLQNCPRVQPEPYGLVTDVNIAYVSPALVVAIWACRTPMGISTTLRSALNPIARRRLSTADDKIGLRAHIMLGYGGQNKSGLYKDCLAPFRRQDGCFCGKVYRN